MSDPSTTMNATPSTINSVDPAFVGMSLFAEMGVSAAQKIASLRSLVALSSQWLWQTDENFALSGMTRGAQTRTKISPAKSLGLSWWDNPAFSPAFNARWDELKTMMHQRTIFHDFLVCTINLDRQLSCIALSGAPQYDEQGKFLGYIGIANALSEQDSAHNALLRLWHGDPLTGYANWKTLSENFQQGLILSKRKGKSLGYIHVHIIGGPSMIDVHEFPRFIATLQAVAERLTLLVRRGDVLGRIAASEFSLLLFEITQRADLHRVEEKIRTTLAQPLAINGESLTIQVDTTCRSAPDDGEQFSALVQSCREALTTSAS